MWARVEFYVDGAKMGSQDTAPFSFGWDTGENPAPPRSHAMNLGYHEVFWKGVDYGGAVFGYADTVVIDFRTSFECPADASTCNDEYYDDMLAWYKQQIASAVANGKHFPTTAEVEAEYKRRGLL